MGHPVTTNPLIIMLINMTVVFIVLIALSFLIRLIHVVDPTYKKEEPQQEASAPAPVAAAEPAPVVEEGIPQEVVAVIAAAVAAYGCGAAEIKAIRPLDRPGWKQSGRFPSKNS